MSDWPGQELAPQTAAPQAPPAVASSAVPTLRPVISLPDKPPPPPSGYRPTTGGNLEVIPGGPADPNSRAGMVPTPGDTSKTGEDYLATLDPTLAGEVRALSDGRRAFPTGTALKDPRVQELIAAATQYDPALDAANAASRVNTRKDFTSGQTAKNITSLNTALGHLGQLSQAADDLQNTWLPAYNTVGNWLQTATGDPRVKNFKLARDAVANELMRVFRGAGSGSEKEIDEWKKNIDSSDSPAQLKAEISKAVELLDSRLQAIGDQYSRGMGKSADPISFLSPHAQAVYNALAPGGTGQLPPPGAPPGDNTPPPGNNPGGGTPTDVTGAAVRANGITFGPQDTGPFDRNAYLQKTYGVSADQEAALVGDWNAVSGNKNLTVDQGRQIYQSVGLPPPDDATLQQQVMNARKGASFQGIDTAAAEKAYTDQLDAAIKARGDNPESFGETAGINLGQGITLNGLDELAGLGGAVRALAQGDNPVAGYQAERDIQRREQDRSEAAHPIAAPVFNVAGGAMTAPIAFGDANTVAGALKAGAALGGAAGFNSGEGLGGSLTGALTGAATGAALGAAGQKIGDTLAARRAAKATAAEAPAVEAPGAEGVAAPLGANDQAEIAGLAKKATSWGPTARQARQTLARKAAANPEAKAAAERLGVDVPPDILSDNAQVQSLAGLARSQAGSEAETGWRATSARVSQQADQALQDIGGNSDLAQVSDETFHRLNGAAQSLERQASALREDVNAQIDPAARVEATNLQNVVADLINNYGGLAEAKAAMTPQERSLLTMLGEGETAIQPTYARLDRLRSDIGEALSKNQGPWADVNRHQLGEYYKALADDQMAAVEQMGGSDLADKQKAANTLFSQMYDQRGQMQDLFGKNLEGSLAPILRRAVTGATKGDAKGITQLLSRIPEDARGGAVVSAVMAQSRSTAAHGGFSFANYAKLYRGLRQNAPIFKQIAKAVGPEGTRVLTDLYTISNRMAAGEANVLKTGKANQVLSSAVQAEGLLGSVMNAAGHRVVAGAGAAVGGAVAGPAGAVGGAALATGTKDALMTAGASRLDKVHTLLSSPTFKAAVEKFAQDGDAAAAETTIWRDTAFHRFAKGLGYVTTAAKRAFLQSLIPGAVRVTSEAAGSAFSGPAKLAAQPNSGTSTTGGAQQ